MEYYQQIQNRTQQTVAVINVHVPTMTVGGVDAAGLTTRSTALDGLAGVRDARLTTVDQKANHENNGQLLIRKMSLGLPLAIEAELDEDIRAEAALLDLLAPAYAITPDTTENAVKRGRKVVAALLSVNPYLTGLTPPRAEITSGGRGLEDLTTALDAQDGLEQQVETATADANLGRTELRIAATTLDRLNKRFYKKLLAEAKDNAALAEALKQIETEGGNLPPTLGIRRILQGGAGGLQLLISYDNGSFDDTLTNTLESMVEGVDQEFTHTVAADPSGNALGPYTAGQVVKLRTRTRNANGTTTGSVRTLTIQTPG
jgi:hypothetical protein